MARLKFPRLAAVLFTLSWVSPAWAGVNLLWPIPRDLQDHVSRYGRDLSPERSQELYELWRLVQEHGPNQVPDEKVLGLLPRQPCVEALLSSAFGKGRNLRLAEPPTAPTSTNRVSIIHDDGAKGLPVGVMKVYGGRAEGLLREILALVELAALEGGGVHAPRILSTAALDQGAPQPRATLIMSWGGIDMEARLRRGPMAGPESERFKAATMRAARWLARLHRDSSLADLAPMSALVEHYTGYEIDRLRSFADGLPGVLSGLTGDGVLLASLAEPLRDLARRVEADSASSVGEVIHGDAHVGNFLMEDAGDDITVIDADKMLYTSALWCEKKDRCRLAGWGDGLFDIARFSESLWVNAIEAGMPEDAAEALSAAAVGAYAEERGWGAALPARLLDRFDMFRLRYLVVSVIDSGKKYQAPARLRILSRMSRILGPRTR